LKETQSERADDLPVIIHWLKQMEIEKLIDQELPPPHGNRQGLSYGQLAVLLLTYMTRPKLTIDSVRLNRGWHPIIASWSGQQAGNLG
jgi:hypothetical protein